MGVSRPTQYIFRNYPQRITHWYEGGTADNHVTPRVASTAQSRRHNYVAYGDLW